MPKINVNVFQSRYAFTQNTLNGRLRKHQRPQNPKTPIM
jgi:hypothetical protein